MKNNYLKFLAEPVLKGLISSAILLLIYIIVVYFVSSLNQLEEQIAKYWYYVLALALGFGIQVGLYSYLKNLTRRVSPKVLVTSGTTTTAAMISCCSHYLVNLLPILGVAGIVTLISQYQIQLFWVGLLSNLAGTAYILIKIKQVKVSL